MKITGLYIDGYRNIKDTYLSLKDSDILAISAPNNYGKSNLVEAIHNTFFVIKLNDIHLFDHLVEEFFHM